MSKPKLGIDIDEVLRAKWLAFDKYYADDEQYGEDKIKAPFDTYNLMNHYEFVDTEIEEQEVMEDFLNDEKMAKLSPKEYVVDPATGKAPVDDFIFKTTTKKFTAQEMFDKFLYEDYCYEIHGSAPKLYMNADVDLNVFLKRYKDYFDFVFFCKTRREAIPSTLFFLSKMRIECKNIVFVYNNDEIWDQVDWIVTTDPTFEERPDGKKIVILDRLYNQDIQPDYRARGIHVLNQEITAETPNEFLEYVKNNIN
jgi:hypothetical protein